MSDFWIMRPFGPLFCVLFAFCLLLLIVRENTSGKPRVISGNCRNSL